MDRLGQSGVTLIEMLAALSVSALIGLAGFTLLESVLQTETALTGRLEGVAQQDRAFQLFALDLSQARSSEPVGDGALKLRSMDHSVIWMGSDDGLERRITFVDRPDVVQILLQDATELVFEGNPIPVVLLGLPAQDVQRVFRLPTGAAR